MAEKVSDEAFARAVQQAGVISYDQLETAKAAQAESAAKGVLVSLADTLVQQGLITPATRENVEKKVRAQQQGGLQQLGQYKLLKKLGEGGMGAVYLAEDTVAQRQIALKVLPKKHASDPAFLTRFRREAQATGNLNHVNIAGAHTVGEEMGYHYLVMEYVEGEPLDKTLKRGGALPWDKALEIVMQVARGLKHAHEHGTLHRDIKPGNIIVTPNGVAKILDLGLSKTIGGDEQTFHTQTGVALGTPHYLSPEQARGGKSIDGRADIYSLGATFYHLVTGQTPFEGSTAAVIMLKHLNEQLPNPQDIVADIPDGVAHVIMKMMAKEPNDRYRDCKELLDDLELVIDGKTPSSSAIEAGKSSVARRRVAQAVQPGGRKPVKVQQARSRYIGAQQREPLLVPGASPSNRKPLYIGACVAVLGLLALIVVLATTSPSRDREGADAKPLTGAGGAEAAARAAEERRKAEAQHRVEETRLKESAAKLEAEKQKLEADKRKAEEAKLEEERRMLAEERRKLEEARLAAEAEAKKKAEASITTVEPPPMQPDDKVARPDTKAGEAAAEEADARAAKAQQILNAVLKEVAPLLSQNKLSDGIALLERKSKDPALADAAELLKQEKAGVEAVVELRKAAIEALRKKVGQQVTLKKGGTEFTGKVVSDPQPDVVTLDMGGAQMTFAATLLPPEDVDQYAPGTGNVGADMRQRGIMYLAAGNVAKAKEYFTRPETLNPKPYLDRIAAIEVTGSEAAALKAWERAERLFAAKDMKGAKAAYEAFERDHGKTQAAAKQAAALKERYDAIEKALGQGGEIALDLGGGVKMEAVLIKAGEFDMGANDGPDEEKPVHSVKISQPFYIGKYDVTVAQFRVFAEALKFQTEAERQNKGWTIKDGRWQEVPRVNWRNPGFKQEDNHPVVVVTWNDAQDFCKWATIKTGRTVRLPTEAQWEYCCRAGTTTRYYTGNQDWELEPAAWFNWNASLHTNACGQKKPNAWGLYDMHGNVWEWVQDCFSDKYYADSPLVDPQGPASGGDRVLRGGSWYLGPGDCRAAHRLRSGPGLRYADRGFRCAVDL